ncbi:MAG: universal stress protein [Proteobacteria bacterium]|nr:universal stress protein [Pseudomonadota bacterium]MDA1357487.1 universal stress protein [Pseudomonadota bacterium]
MYETILLPLDLNETSSWEKALPAAADLCRISGGTLHVMTVLPGYGMNLVGQYFPEGAEEAGEAAALDELKKLTAELVPKGIALEHSVVQGAVHEQIVATAERIGADPIVMAARRAGLADFLLGDNAYRVVRRYSHSVMVVRT